MNPPRALQPRHVRYSARHQARLDAETHAKLQELAAAFRRKRSAILCYVMQWGLTQTRGGDHRSIHPYHSTACSPADGT
jgi:hypothetical protein